jgi:hypothetical protein
MRKVRLEMAESRFPVSVVRLVVTDSNGRLCEGPRLGTQRDDDLKIPNIPVKTNLDSYRPAVRMTRLKRTRDLPGL